MKVLESGAIKLETMKDVAMYLEALGVLGNDGLY